MDTKRNILAVLLCVAVWLVFMEVMRARSAGRTQWVPVAPPPAAGPAAVPALPAEGPPAGGAPLPVMSAGFVPTPARQPEVTLTLQDSSVSHLRVEMTSRGASLRKLSLGTFDAAVGSDGDLLLLDEFENGRMSLGIQDRLAGAAHPDLRTAVWEVEETTPTRAIFRYARADGLVFRKVIGLAGDYLLRGSFSIESRAAAPLQVRLAVVSAAGVASEDTPGAGDTLYYMTGVAGHEAGGAWTLKQGWAPAALAKKAGEKFGKERAEMERSRGRPLTPGEIEDLLASSSAPEELQPEGLRWAGTADKYFAAVLVPEGWGDLVSVATYEPVTGSRRFEAARVQQEQALQRALTFEELQTLRTASAASVAAVYRLRDFPLLPGGAKTLAWSFYAGPKDPGVLERHAALGLGALVDYGFWASISKLLLWLLLSFHAITGNFGVAIILLTILVRLCLFPISRKSQVSMYRMQKLQPQIKALQERYKNDKQRQVVEQQRLWKEHRVNPMSGCLPLFLQLPVFVGLYRALELAIDLRHARFVLWIRDLSQPDRLCPLPFRILGQTHLNLLPVLMLLPMVAQSLLTPKPADPAAAQQQKMMVWMMPAMFLLMCYSMPSGVSLYWLCSSLWGLGEYRLIKKVWLRDDPPAGGAPAGGAASAIRAAGVGRAS